MATDDVTDFTSSFFLAPQLPLSHELHLRALSLFVPRLLLRENRSAETEGNFLLPPHFLDQSHVIGAPCFWTRAGKFVGEERHHPPFPTKVGGLARAPISPCENVKIG